MDKKKQIALPEDDRNPKALRSRYHLTTDVLLRTGFHFLIGVQLPDFLRDNSGKTECELSRSNDSAVLSSNKRMIAAASGSISTTSRVLPLTSGNRRNLLLGVRFFLAFMPRVCWAGRCASRPGADLVKAWLP